MQRTLPRLHELRYDMSWLEQWRTRYADALTDARYSVLRPNATLFMYVWTPNGVDGFAFTNHSPDKGVLVMPAPVLHDRGHFRIAFTGSDGMLEPALPIQKRAATQ